MLLFYFIYKLQFFSPIDAYIFCSIYSVHILKEQEITISIFIK